MLFSGNLETPNPKNFPAELTMVKPKGAIELSKDYLPY